MNLPHSNKSYNDVKYWDARYREEEQYDWLAGYGLVKHILGEKLKRFGKDAKILHLGCGNSSLPMDLYNDGWTDITNIDISEVVVDRMKEQHGHMKWLAMDMTKMTFPDDTFDIVLEKATLDSLLVEDTSPWEPSTPAKRLLVSCLTEVERVTKPSGTFVSITFSQPHFRVPLLCSPGLGWAVGVDTFSKEGGFDYYVMVAERGDPGPALERWRLPVVKVEERGSSRTNSSGSEGEEFVNKICLDDDEDEYVSR